MALTTKRFNKTLRIYHHSFETFEKEYDSNKPVLIVPIIDLETLQIDLVYCLSKIFDTTNKEELSNMVYEIKLIVDILNRGHDIELGLDHNGYFTYFSTK